MLRQVWRRPLRPVQAAALLCCVLSEGASLCGVMRCPSAFWLASGLQRCGPGHKLLQQPQWWPELVRAHTHFAWPQHRVPLSPLQCRRPSPTCPSSCSDLDPSQRGNTVTSTRHFRKSKTSRPFLLWNLLVSGLAGVKCFLVAVLELKTRWYLCATV